MYDIEVEYEPERARPHIEPVYKAIHHGYGPQAVTQLLQYLPPTFIDVHWHGMTLICHAIMHQDTHTLELLLERKADVTRISRVFDPENQVLRTETPLITAARLGCLNALKMIVEARVNLDLKDFTTGKTALHWACVNPATRECVFYLAQIGAEVNSRDHYLETPMTKVIRTKDFDVVKCLLKYNVCVNNPVNYQGNTALIFALLNSALQIARLLVRAGGDVSAVDNNQHDPLLLAINQSLAPTWEVLVVCQLLLSAGAKVNEQHLQAVSDRDSPHLQELIQVYSSTPAPLAEQARKTVRKVLIVKSRDCSILPVIDKLPLPKSMLRYLKLLPISENKAHN